MTASFCPSCGSPFGTVAAFCPNCGAQVAAVAAAHQPDPATPKDTERATLVASLTETCRGVGMILRERPGGLGGTSERIMVRWPLGGMRFRQVVECDIDEAQRLVRWHERFIENGWGLQPPMANVTSTKVFGKALSGRRSWASPFGSGSVDYGQVRGAAEAAVRAAGWRFELRLLPSGPGRVVAIVVIVVFVGLALLTTLLPVLLLRQ